MKKIFVLVFALLFVGLTYGQQYKSHKVAKGENVFRIAKRYNTTQEEIFRANPTAKDGIKEGEVLAIPVIDDQEYRTHVVVEGDTVYNLSRKYKISEELLYTLNPEAKNGINLGQILRVGRLEKNKGTKEQQISDPILDSIKPLPEIRKLVGFKTYKVKKRKETLYSIAKSYNITVEDIKKHNKRLYSEHIKKRDKIRIPIFEEDSSLDQGKVSTADTLGNRLLSTTRYIIKPKETKFSIARRHGITIAQLEQLNPGLDSDFQIGREIIVPTTIFVPLEEKIDTNVFELYEVPENETIYSILKRTNISSDSLFSMNPYLKDGLKSGMVITLPKRSTRDSLAINFAERKADNLENMLSNFKTKRIAVMLPFGLDTLNLEARNEIEDFIKSRKGQGIRVALDFYKGVRIAVDSAKTKGLSVELSVYDTQKNNNVNHIKRVINDNNFDELDAVVGPLYQANVEAVAAELKKYDTPVFSPISKKESKLYSNFFQTRPTDIMLQDKLMAYVENDPTDKNIIIITQQGKKHEKVKERLIAKFPDAKVAKIEKGNYLYEVNLNKVLVKNKLNWVIFESDDVAMISNVSTLLNAKVESHKVTLFTTDKNDAFEDDSIKNEYLSKLHLHYPSIDKEYDNYTNKKVTPFVARYKKQYGTIPNKYSVRGFDITYDILMRLGTADDLYHAASFEGTTEYVENKFNYAKKLLGGYYNKASYIIKFDDDLKLTVIE